MGKLPLIVFLLLIMPFAAQAESCRAAKDFTTAIHIDLQTPPPVLDTSKTIAQINQGQDAQHEEWLKKNGMQTIWKPENMETAGTTSGAWGAFPEIKMWGKSIDLFGYDMCPYFEKISMSFMYRSIITIPKEFPKDSCAYKVILVHETKHHNTNVKIVQEAIARFQKDLPTIVLDIEKSSAGTTHNEIDATIKSIVTKTGDAFKVYLVETIAAEMKRQNALIDSPEEYMRGTELLKECGAIKK